MKVIPSDEKTGVISRITELLDPGSFMEMGERVSARYTEFYHPDSVVESDGVVTGYGTVNGSLVFVYAQDNEVMGGTFGEQHGRKIVDLYERAVKAKAPVIGLLDCAGFRIEEGLDGLYALIGAGIIDDRDRKPLSFRFFNSGNDQVEIVGGRDQIDILGILVLQLQKNLGEPFGLDLHSGHRLSDRIILAVDTAHIAA